MLDKIIFYLQYPFVRYAIIVGILISLSSSLLGVTLVLKRFSYIGDGLSHVAFGAMAIATVLKLTDDSYSSCHSNLCCPSFKDRSKHKS